MAYDSSKPVTGGSLVAADIRENFRALKEDEIVAAASVSDASVTQAKLKTTTAESSSSVGGESNVSIALPGGNYGLLGIHYKATDQVTKATLLNDNTGVSYEIQEVYFEKIDAGSATVYVQQRYVQASGEVFWYMVLRDKVTKKVLAEFAAPDHPCMMQNGGPEEYPHPWKKRFDPEKHEIIVVNPTKKESEQIAKDAVPESSPEIGWLEAISKRYKVNENSNGNWPEIPVTVGLPKRDQNGELVDWRFAPPGTKVTPIRKIIEKPDYIKSLSFEKRML